MKRIVLVCLILALLAACQPTPAEDVVVNKAEGNLEHLIEQTPSPKEGPVSAAPESGDPAAVDVPNTQKPVLDVPAHVKDDYSGPVYGGTLVVDLDADVTLPAAEACPVYSGHIGHAGADENERLTRLLLGDGPYYKVCYDQKRSWLKEGMLYQAWLEAIDEGIYGTENERLMQQTRFRESIEDSMQNALDGYRDLPDEFVPEPWTGSFSDERFFVMNADGTVLCRTDGNLHYCERDAMQLVSFYSPHAPRTDAEQAAIDTAVAFANGIGWADFTVEGVSTIDDGMRRMCHLTNGFDGGCFFVTLTPTYAGFPVRQYQRFQGSDLGAAAVGASEGVNRDRPQETIQATVMDGRVVRFEWNDPFVAERTENENVQLLPFETILDAFKKNIFFKIYMDEAGDYTMWLHVTDIRLSYMRVRIKDSDQFYLLPVWDFFGYSTYSENETPTDGTLEWFSYLTLLTVNAIDGSVIDRNVGY